MKKSTLSDMCPDVTKRLVEDFDRWFNEVEAERLLMINNILEIINENEKYYYCLLFILSVFKWLFNGLGKIY